MENESDPGAPSVQELKDAFPELEDHFRDVTRQILREKNED